LVVHPDGILVTAKSRIEGGKALVEIDVEYCFVRRTVIVLAAESEKQKAKS
jgi:hypothetical protein